MLLHPRLLLTASTLDLVLKHKLVNEEELLGPSFSIQDVGGRNRSQLLTTASAAFLVKTLDTPRSAEREAAGLSWGAGDTVAEFSTPLVRVIDGATLVTETPPGLRSIAHLVARQRYPRTLLRRLGRSLAKLHLKTVPPDLPSAEYLPLALNGAAIAVLNESPGVRAVLADVYADRTLMAALQGLVDQPAASRGPAHGDLRPANLLIGKGTLSDADLYLIDWETAGVADPMVDVGAAICQVLTISMRSSTTGPDRIGLRVLLASYQAAGGPLDLARAMRRAGVSLIQQATEAASRTDHISSLAQTSLRIARIALLTPESLAVQLRLVS